MASAGRNGLVLYGIHAVYEALLAPRVKITRLLLAAGRGGGAIEELLQLARSQGIPVERKDHRYLDELTAGQPHQGVLGLCPAFPYADLADVLSNRSPALVQDLVVLLDGLQDPRNFGAIIRSAYCFGANGVVIPERRTVSVTGVVIKASAGAAYHLPIARVANLGRAIEVLKDSGFWICAAAAEGEPIGTTLRSDVPLGLLFGSEGRGIRPLLRRNCDFLVAIPMLGRIDSLNVSVAAGIFLYEAARGRLADTEHAATRGGVPANRSARYLDGNSPLWEGALVDEG